MDAKKLHEKYGDAVRIAPNEVTFTDPEAWKEIFAIRPGKPQRPKDQRHVSVGPNHIPSILRTDDQTHARYRRSLSHGFSEGSLQRQEVIVKGYVDLLVQRLHGLAKSGSTIVDMTCWYNYTTFGSSIWGIIRVPPKFSISFLGFGHLQPFPHGCMGERIAACPSWKPPHEMDHSKRGSRAEETSE